MRLISSPLRSLLAAGLGLLLVLSSPAARAGFQNDITVRLLAPGGSTIGATPVDASQVVSASTAASLAAGVAAGDGGEIGSDWLLDGEKLFFDNNSILLRIGVGDDTTGGVYTTGYRGLDGAHAFYRFEGLSIAGKTIVGFNIFAWDGFGTTDNGSGSGLGNPGVLNSLANLIDANTLTFDLDTLEIAQRLAGSSNNFAEFRIDLITRDDGTDPGGTVPEPATLALVAMALVGAGMARRRA